MPAGFWLQDLRTGKGKGVSPRGIALVLAPALRLAQQSDPGYVLSGHRDQAVGGVCVFIWHSWSVLPLESFMKRKGKGFNVGLYQDSSWELIRDTVRGSAVCTAI